MKTTIIAVLLLISSTTLYASFGDECFKQSIGEDENPVTKYIINNAAKACRGSIGNLCFKTFRKRNYSFKQAVDYCSGGVSDVCFREHIRSDYLLKDSALRCKGVTNDTCFKYFIKANYTETESKKRCRDTKKMVRKVIVV